MIFEPMTIECVCPFCGAVREVTVCEYDYMAWELSDMRVQDAFPYLSPEERELLISGICSDCWNKMFSE